VKGKVHPADGRVSINGALARSLMPATEKVPMRD
jgi:hypothetical protein